MLTWYNWLIVILPFSCVLYMAFHVRKYIRSVPDFLAGGRICGRYLLSVGSMESGLSVMALSAETAGTFIPLVREISPGLWLEKGRILGKIVSGENLFYAYAQDKGGNRIKPGDKADIKLAAN